MPSSPVAFRRSVLDCTRLLALALPALVLPAVPLPARAAITRNEAMQEVSPLLGSWNCGAGDKVRVVTFALVNANWIRASSTEPQPYTDTFTFDPNRGKWVLFGMGANGAYRVAEGSPDGHGGIDFAAVYPERGPMQHYALPSPTKMIFGDETCTKK